MAASYKTVSDTIHPVDFVLIRNICAFAAILVWVYVAQVNPFKSFPLDKKWPMFWRLVTGQLDFLLVSMASAMAPITLVMVLW